MSTPVLPVLIVAGALVAASSSATAAKPPPRTPELVERGRVSFERNCVACHGEKGLGDGPAAAELNPKPRNLATTRLDPKGIFEVLAHGREGTAMIAFTHLPEEERWALAYFVHELGKPEGKKR